MYKNKPGGGWGSPLGEESFAGVGNSMNKSAETGEITCVRIEEGSQSKVNSVPGEKTHEKRLPMWEVL